MKRILIILAVLLLVAAPAYAQDGTTIVTPESAFEIFVGAMSAIVLGSFGSAPITVTVVQILKRIRLFDRFSAPTLTFVVSTILWIGLTLATHFGVQMQFNTAIDFFVKFIAPLIVGILTTSYAAPVIYDSMKAKNVGFIGTPRKTNLDRVVVRG